MKLTVKEISFLAKLYDNKTKVSLFANINSTLDGTEEKSLIEKGVYNNGTLTEAAKQMLDTVAHAEKCSRVMLKDNFYIIEKYAYKYADDVVLVENQNGDMIFSMPSGFAKNIGEISEFTGMSKIKTADIEILLPSDEMMVLVAVMDIYRRNVLCSYIGQEKMQQEISIAQITQQLNESISNSLVKMLKNNYNYTAPDDKDIKQLLEKLAGKKCVIFENNYKLTAEYEFFAANFLIPETILTLEALNLNSTNEVVWAGALCICAGVKDVASFIFSKNEIEIASISGMQMLQMAENFLSCPDVI